MNEPPPLPEHATIRLRTDRISFVEVDGKQVILDTRHSVYYAVNETGGQLWLALRTGATEADLRRILMEAHGVTEETATLDIAAFLHQLEEHGLIVRSKAALPSSGLPN